MILNAPETDHDPIDAVITWVDGQSAKHLRKRQRYMEVATASLHENAINPHRWLNNDEIYYCLRSIENHAPWVRKIWILVDEETPDISTLSPSLRAKVHFAYHREIFDGFSEMLPTFNSLAIESMLWRIEGLSERFMYFNDDVFVTAPLLPIDMFRGTAPVLRGAWVDDSALLADPAIRADPAKFNHFMQINAARIAGFGADRLFSAAHVVHPMLRSQMQHLFSRYPEAFTNNIAHRFRDLSQFLPQGLHNHACIRDACAILSTAQDHLHIYSGQGSGRPGAQTLPLLQKAATPEIKFLCINDLPQLEALIPNARDWINHAIGIGPAPL